VDLCADWIFPSARKLHECFRAIRTLYTWSRNKRRNDHFDGSLYLNQHTWDCLIYDKGAEVVKEPAAHPDAHKAHRRRKLSGKARFIAAAKHAARDARGYAPAGLQQRRGA